MKHEEKIKYMQEFCKKQGLVLNLEAECGFGRECVGVLFLFDGNEEECVFPDYQWSNKDYTKRQDKNGEVWTPDNAYHKHACVAVLGRGEVAESQLYDWLKWFDDNNFKFKTGKARGNWSNIDILMNNHRYARMVRQ